MPAYVIAPRRSMHYHPFAPMLGHNHYTPTRSLPALVPSLFRGIEEEFASLDSLFNRAPVRSYQPRFDVREENDAFQLIGEVPGVEAENLQVEFVDRNTLVVKGRSVKESQRSDSPVALKHQATSQDKGEQKAVESSENQATTPNDTMETEPTDRPSTPASTSSNYHKATVEDTREDGDDFVDVAAEDNNTTAAEPRQQTETLTTNNTVTAQEATHEQSAQQQPAKDEGHYWVSERSVGEFQRSFRFPGQVDQENVKANLKDGVLRVVVPKVKQSGPRRIQVE